MISESGYKHKNTILVDTSVWIEHLRDGNAELERLLNNGRVISHLYIIGELACGNLKNRSEILSLFQAIPQSTIASHYEVLIFIEEKDLMGKGLGYIDVHLLASAVLSDSLLWTHDKKLSSAASVLGLNY